MLQFAPVSLIGRVVVGFHLVVGANDKVETNHHTTYKFNVISGVIYVLQFL